MPKAKRTLRDGLLIEGNNSRLRKNLQSYAVDNLVSDDRNASLTTKPSDSIDLSDDKLKTDTLRVNVPTRSR